MATSIDPEALLVALALDPTTFSRNRFFGLYTEPAARKVRSRAAQLRNVVWHLLGGAGAQGVVVSPTEADGALVSYEVPALGLKRTAALDALELAVVRFVLARAANGRALPPALQPDPSDGPRIEAVLARLLPEEELRGSQAS